MAAIDYDKGVQIRQHPQTGMRVYMYVNEPGVFLNAHGDQVKPVLAAEAGYPVEKLLKERAKRERLAQAAQVIEQEFQGGSVQEVVEEKSGYKIVHVGDERHNVLDPDGNKLNEKRSLSLPEAQKLLGAFVTDKDDKKK